MIANTRKMYEIRNRIAKLLEEEILFYKMLESFADFGKVSANNLEEFINISGWNELKDHIIPLTKEQALNNPYLRDIKIPKVVCGNIQLSNGRIIRPNTLTTYMETVRNLDDLKPVTTYFWCDKALRYPAIGNVGSKISWMTVEPIEINSFNKFIEETSGNVLLLGCGLGYVAYMLSLKDNVDSITIVDIDEDILNVFNQYILPQFKNKDKINTILSDGMEYLNTANLNSFDYVNVDVWKTPDDMILFYLPCLEVEAKYPKVNFSYWIEESLKEQLQKNILAIIGNVNGELDGELYRDLFFDGIYEDIAQEIVEKTPINSWDDISNIIKLDNLRVDLYNWYIGHKEEFKISSVKVRAKIATDQRLANMT